VYVGDDRTDEHAFDTLRDGDVGVGVGPRPLDRFVDWRLDGPDSVGRFFAHLADRLG
jgi:trehalose 6-phosphate phosphatase